MKEQMTMNQNFWSGVINYIRASANNAEALRPWDFRVPKEVKTVLVYKTSVEGLTDMAAVAGPMDELVGTKNWTIDLEDVDRVLRVVCVEDKSDGILNILHQADFICEPLG